MDGATGSGDPQLLPGVVVTSITPDPDTVQAAAMLIVLLAAEGANVAAMVPVETGVDDACEAGSSGALVRWAAAHMDDPRHVTPFALSAARSTMHAADAEKTLLHGAAFDRAREDLCDGRTVLVVADTIGMLDPITPSLTMLDLTARWQLSAVLVEPVSRWSLGHLRLLAVALQARGAAITGVILTAPPDDDADLLTAVRDTVAALLDCPVLVLPRVQSAHDRAELLSAAQQCGMTRLVSRMGIGTLPPAA